MKKLPTLLVLSSISLAARAATLVDTTYSTTQTISTATDYFLEGGSTATWTINSGINVTSSVLRFFIATTAAPNAGTATFVFTGGGTFTDTNSNAFAFRMGQDATSEPGSLLIQGGTTFVMTNTQGPWSQASGSNIVLSGLGSTFVAYGTYNSGSGTYNRGAISGEALAISAIGGTLQTSYNAGSNVTTFTVVPEPSTYGLFGAGALAAVAMVRRRRKA